MKPEQLLGRRIRELRKTRKLTIERLAERMGVNDKYLGAVERGEQNPSFRVLMKAAKALAVELTDLFRIEHTDENEKVLQRKIGDLVKKSAPEQLRIIFKIIKSVVE